MKNSMVYQWPGIQKSNYNTIYNRTKRVKYLGINLKNMQDQYVENYKTLVKKSNRHTIFTDWSLNIVTTGFLSNLKYKHNAIPQKQTNKQKQLKSIFQISTIWF